MPEGKLVAAKKPVKSFHLLCVPIEVIEPQVRKVKMSPTGMLRTASSLDTFKYSMSKNFSEPI